MQNKSLVKIHLGVPLPWILKRSFDTTFKFFKENIKITGTRKKSEINLTLTVLTNCCHSVYEHVVKEKNRELNYFSI